MTEPNEVERGVMIIKDGKIIGPSNWTEITRVDVYDETLTRSSKDWIHQALTNDQHRVPVVGKTAAALAAIDQFVTGAG